MEKGVNNKEIDRYNQLNKNQLFFIQRWLEILNVNTHSSYAIKYLNSHQALNELVYVIDGMLNGDINANNHHLRVVIEEAREVVTNDWLLREQLEHYYLILTTRLKGIPKANEKTQLHSLVYQINYILRELKKTYLTSIVDKINQLLGSQQDGTKKELKELDFLIKSLVSELIALGWSNKRLYESVKDGLLTSKLRDSSWDAFFVELLKSERKFICLFKFNSKPSKDMLRKMEILSMDCVTGPHVTNTQMDELLKPHIKKHHVYLRVITKAYDYYSAHDSAWSKIERNMDMLQFYGFKLPDVNKSAFVIDDS